jgi:hypothetical protein
VTPTPETTPASPTTSAPAPSAATSVLDEALAKAPAEAEGAKPDAPATKAEPPAKYADFTVPEGVKLEGEALDKASALMRESGLSQEQAQKFVDFHAAALKAAAEGPAAMWKDTQDTWIDELRSDPTLGKGIENGTVGASIAKMISALPAPQATAFREAMNFTGAGNNPAIVRGFYELSKRFAEPGHVQGNAPAQVKTKPAPAQALYPDNPKG